MKFIQVEARFKAGDITLAEDLICNIFFSYNLKGVVCNVPIEEPDEGFGTSTLPLPEFNSVTGFFPAIDASLEIISAMKQRFKKLTELDIQVEISTCEVDEKEWEDAWKGYFEVTPITDRIIVKPEWKSYKAKPGELIIHLDPGMAFGTGTHPTTSMCINLIEKHLVPGHDFLDIGTGSGILMIAASLLGANDLYGIDTDPCAVDIAKKNIKNNKIPDRQIFLECRTLDKTQIRPFNIIAANIIAQVIVDITGDMKKRMNNQTVAILSGIIKDRLADVLEALETHHLHVIEQLTTDEWVALAVKKMPDD